MEQMDLFGAFGITPSVKQDNKQTEKKEKHDRKNKSTVKEVLYELPITINTGYHEPLVIVPSGEMKKLSLKNIRKKLCECFSEYAQSITVLTQDKTNKSVFYAQPKSNLAFSKGKLKLGSDMDMKLGNVAMDLSSFMTDETCEVEISDIENQLKVSYPELAKIRLFVAGKKILIFPFNKPLNNENLPEFPMHGTIFGRTSFDITEEEYKQYMASQGNKEDDSVDVNGIKDYLFSLYPDFPISVMNLQVLDNGALVLSYNTAIENKQADSKTLIPVKDVQLAVYGTYIPLDPSMFDGNEKVSESDFIVFLSKRYPEHGKDNTTITYMKDSGYVVPVLKGKSKGAVASCLEIVDCEQFEERVKQPFPFLLKKEETLFRVEKTAVSLIQAPMEGNFVDGKYEFLLPKIPGELIGCWDAFFKEVADEFHSEVLVQLYYDRVHKNYFIHLPEQTVSGSYIDATNNEEYELNYIRIMDIHSHCYYPPFWSNIDNADEVENCLFMVFGDYSGEKETPNFLLRAGTGGYYVNINHEDIFTNIKAPDAMIEVVKEALMNQVRERLTVVC